RTGSPQGPPGRTVCGLPSAAAVDRRRLVLPAAVGPAHRRCWPRLPVRHQRQPARLTGDRTNGVRRCHPGDGCRRDPGNKGGAVVTRRLWLDVATADYAREALSFPGLRILLRVDSETRQSGTEPKTETRYFATAVAPVRITPDGLLAAVRGHWQVENGLHFIKDRWWDEDRHYSKQPRVALGFAVLLNAVVT